jgi:hypothetical protein
MRENFAFGIDLNKTHKNTTLMTTWNNVKFINMHTSSSGQKVHHHHVIICKVLKKNRLWAANYVGIGNLACACSWICLQLLALQTWCRQSYREGVWPLITRKHACLCEGAIWQHLIKSRIRWGRVHQQPQAHYEECMGLGFRVKP